MRVLIVVALFLAAGCITVRNPGSYELPDPAPPAPPAPQSPAAISVDFRGFEWGARAVALGAETKKEDGAPSPRVADRLEATFRKHLARDGGFHLSEEGQPVALMLEGEILKIEQPGESEPRPRPEDSSQEESGTAEAVAVAVLGAIYGVAVLFGAPTDCKDAEVDLLLRVREPEFRQVLAEWPAKVKRRSCAGLYYAGHPLAEALAEATQALVDRARAEVPGLVERVAGLSSWAERYGVADYAPGEATSIRAAIRALGDNDVGVRARAARALARAEVERALAASALVEALGDLEPLVRREAILALVALKATDPKPIAVLAARDVDPEVRALARTSAARLGVEGSITGLNEVQRQMVRRAAMGSEAERLKWLTKIALVGSAAKDVAVALTQLLNDPSPEIRAAIIRTLGAIEAPREVVSQSLAEAKHDPEEMVRRAADEVSRRLAFGATSADQLTPASLGRGVHDALAVSAANAAHEEPQVIAVFDLHDSDAWLKASQREQLTAYLVARLIATGAYRTVPRSEIRSRLEDQKLESYRLCYDEGCQIELGRAVAASKVLSTKLLRFENGCTLTATIYDLRTELAERAATREAGCGERELVAAVDAVVTDLTGGR